MDRLGIDRAHVAGNSMGGFVAATLALAHPDGSPRCCSVMRSASPRPSRARPSWRSAQGGNPFLLDDVAAFPAFYAMTMARPPFVPGFVRAAIAEDYVSRRDHYEEIFTDFFGVATLDDRLGEITVPTLVMWGEQDRLVHPSTARVWADGIPGARIVRYPDAGHMPMLEMPRRTAADYRAFLARVERRGRCARGARGRHVLRSLGPLVVVALGDPLGVPQVELGPGRPPAAGCAPWPAPRRCPGRGRSRPPGRTSRACGRGSA